jgi:hypothetical protein
MRPSLHSSICASLCLLALLGCASPKPAANTAGMGDTRDTSAERAQRLINYSVESGEPINTAEGKKLICKQESVTNTRLKTKKTCLTEEEWMARTNNAKEGIHEATRAGEYLPPKGN